MDFWVIVVLVVGEEILNEINMKEFNDRSVEHVRYDDIGMRILDSIHFVGIPYFFALNWLPIHTVVKNVERSHESLIVCLCNLILIVLPYAPRNHIEVVGCNKQQY